MRFGFGFWALCFELCALNFGKPLHANLWSREINQVRFGLGFCLWNLEFGIWNLESEI